MYPNLWFRLRSLRPHFAAGTLLTILGMVAYSNTLNSPFVFDDIPQIAKNDAIRITSLSPSQLWAAGTESMVKGRPLAYLTFALNYYFGGDSEVGFHVVNIAIHIIAALAAYWLALLTMDCWRRTVANPPAWLDSRAAQRISFVCAAIFVLHPIQIQSVTYIVQRMNSLATLLYLLAMALYLCGRTEQRRRPRWLYWSAGLFAWILSLLCKQNSVVLPITVVLYEWYFFRGLSVRWMPRGWKRIALVGTILLMVAAVVSAVSIAQLSLIGDVFDRYQERDFTMGERLLTQPRVLCVYASLVLFPWPTRFNLLHHVDTSRNLFAPPQTILAIGLLAAYGWLIVWTAKRNRLVSFCLLWPVVHLGVESSILPLEMIYEHRMYLPMFGVALLGSYLLFSVASGGLAYLRLPVAVMLLLALGVATLRRNNDWSDSLTLWSDVISKNPHSPRAFVNRGGLYADKSEWKLAIEDYNRAIALDESFDSAWNSRGSLYSIVGDRRRAITNFSAAIMLAKLNDIRVNAYRNRGAAWTAEGYPLRAIADYTWALQIDPTHAPAYANRANAYLSLGDYRKAIADYERCIEVAPNHVGARNNLAALLATCPNTQLRNPKAALSHALVANQIEHWKNSDLLDTLASAYAANGELAQAIQWQSRAVELAPAAKQLDLKRKLDQLRSAAIKPTSP